MEAINCVEHKAKSLDDLFRRDGTPTKFAPGSAIVHQGATASTVFRVQRGCVRSSYYSCEGDRKVLQFLGAGEYLGLGDALHWSVSFEAVDAVWLDAIPRRVFEKRLAEEPSVQAEIRHELVRQIEAHASLLVLTAQTTAVERVRLFLETYARRRANPGFIALPMGRRDIADHLGLSMETVSRAFSTLRSEGVIAMRGANFFRMITASDPVPCLADAA